MLNYHLFYKTKYKIFLCKGNHDIRSKERANSEDRELASGIQV